MGKLISHCAAVALGIALGAQAQAQTPAVTGVTNDRRSSPTVNPGSIGYVLGSGFGTAGNTTVTLGGLSARVLAVSENEIRALFPPNLPFGVATLSVTVDGQVSAAVSVIVSERVPEQVDLGPPMRVSTPHFSETRLTPAPAAAPMATGMTTVSGIVYTCDPSINAVSATACNTLNTTIAALYRNAFTNANSSIYIKMGSTSAGESDWVYQAMSYTTFRNALIASESDTSDTTAVMDSVPAANPYPSDMVGVTTSLRRALGFATVNGLESDGTTSCALSSAGCYDGVITISNAIPLYFRTGTISSDQYDFFSIAEHETDEILGTASCLFCSAGVILPADLFRYHSNGTRSFAVGSNDACTSSDSTNACFSFDAVHMLHQYNNLNNGEDAGDWVTNCSSGVILVQDADSCPGFAGVDISPTAEILVLDVVGFMLVDHALQFFPITPCRLVDTRTGQGKTGQFGPPSLAANASRNFPLVSAGCSIPSTAEAYSLNFTVVPDGPLGYLSVWPEGDPYPGVSTLNSSDGSAIANAAIVPAGASGGITALASNATDLIIDINGYFAPATPSTSLEFFPVTPCRIADTRATQPFTGAFGPPSLAANTTRNFPIESSPCVSGLEPAYSLNMTVVPEGTLGFLSVWPQGDAYPGVSTLNSPDGTTLANAAIVPSGTSGGISVLASNATDLIIDINGTFSAATGGLQFYTLTPCRVADTRASQPFTGQFGPPSLVANAGRNFPIQASPCGVPTTAEAYALNMTVVPPGALSFLSVWPQGEPYPGVSTLNSPDGFVIANAAIVPAGSGGSGGITVLPGNATDLIIDIVGYFAP
jgi:hypothetical protein